MEMVAAEDIVVGNDITPPLSPISYSLHDSFLHSHCSSCFNPLPHPHPHPHNNNPPPPPPPPLLHYCSPSCSSSHSPLHFSSASHHLLLPHHHHHPPIQPSDFRTALILLLQINPHPKPHSFHRICNLITNHHTLRTSTAVQNGAKAIAAATYLRDGGGVSGFSDGGGCFLEEAVLCAVLSNSVEVQDKTGRCVGIAVYGVSFSWINHSCSPNACYRFVPPDARSGDDQRCLIAPASSGSAEVVELAELLTGLSGGPKLVVRSIKKIKKGEEVTIAYTDLLQPKELRQSELWSKYRFTCCCRRCVALPLTHVDQCLQEIRGSDEFFTKCIDDAIDDYLSCNDAESCCKKLEGALLKGFHNDIKLHPQNHLSLNAYTTLASAYSTAASATAMEDESGLKMKRFSVAYSLLLALLTHDLFLYESSLITSVSNFCIGAGESLINLARCLAPSSSGKCYSKCGCNLIDIFEANNEALDISKEQLLNCIREITGKVWKYLVVGNDYLQFVKDPMDLRWSEDLDSKTVVDNSEWCVCDCVEGQEVLKLGAHCLLYGGILSSISGGHDSHLSCYVRRLLDGL